MTVAATETMTVSQAIRHAYPHLRRTRMVGIIRNGGVKRVYECCECGCTISMNAKWPVTKRVNEFVAEHESTCGKKLVADVLGCEGQS